MEKKSKFYKWCERYKNKPWLKVLLTSIAWCYLLLVPIVLMIILVPILGVIFYLIPNWTLLVIGIFWIILSFSIGIITNAIFTNWANKLYGNLKPCLNNDINKQELVPFDYQLADANINSEAKKLTKNWEKRQNSNKKLNKVFNSWLGMFVVKLFFIIIAGLVNFPYIYVLLYFNEPIWVEVITYIGLGIPIFGFNCLTLFIIFDFLFIPLKKYRKKFKKNKISMVNNNIESKKERKVYGQE